MTRCDVRLSLGAYAIGALEPDEAERVRDHLQTCAACRAVHADLAPLPALLDLVDPGASPAAAPSPSLEGSVLAGFAAQRPTPAAPKRRGRWRGLARPTWRVALPSGLAGAAATVALLAATGNLSPDGSGGERVDLTSPSGAGGARAAARLSATSTGTRVDLKATLPPLRRGEVYELWFVRDGGRVSAGTFGVDADGRAELRLATAADPRRYARMGITREPDGLDPARNGPSVAVGRLGRT
jgi:anti-sigma-K factor RskA